MHFQKNNLSNGSDLERSEQHDRVYLRRREAAKYCAISLGTFDACVRRKIFAAIRPSPRVVLFRRADLDRALERYRVAAIGE